MLNILYHLSKSILPKKKSEIDIINDLIKENTIYFSKIKVFNKNLPDDVSVSESYNLIDKISYYVKEDKNTLFIIVHGGIISILNTKDNIYIFTYIQRKCV